MIYIYTLEKIKDKIYNNENTNFVEIKYLPKLKKDITREKYNIYYPFSEATKVILYKKNKPNIVVYEIKSNEKLKHQDILGTLYSLNISDEMFGDVVIDNDRYFIIINEFVTNYIESNLTKIRNSSINLIKRDSDYLKDYKQKYEEITLIVSSYRIDQIVSKIINTSRAGAVDLIKNDNVYINYELVTKTTYILKENDIFSIRKYGKYKYIGVIKKTKSNNFIVKCLKYV